jgi:hypothetical protein
MSNAIDILCVGGPANGKMVCMQKAAATTYIEFPILPDDTRYTRRKWKHPLNEKMYHIASRDTDVVTDEQIIVEIVMANFTPAWDLNNELPIL